MGKFLKEEKKIKSKYSKNFIRIYNKNIKNKELYCRRTGRSFHV